MARLAENMTVVDFDSGPEHEDTARAGSLLRAAPNLPNDVMTALTRLDDRLGEALEQGDIRLLRVEWLLAQPKGYKMQRRQDLEELEYQELSPLFTGAESVALIRNGKREIAALSYGWLLGWDPDPTGERAALLRRALAERPYIKALFWDQATLYQPPRTTEPRRRASAVPKKGGSS